MKAFSDFLLPYVLVSVFPLQLNPILLSAILHVVPCFTFSLESLKEAAVSLTLNCFFFGFFFSKVTEVLLDKLLIEINNKKVDFPFPDAG